jgi:hypothetical protein
MRNWLCFPERFRFQLTQVEYDDLRFQTGTSSAEPRHGGRRYLPYAFTEQGVSMLSAVLRDLEIAKLPDTHNKSRSGFNPTSNYRPTPAVGLKPDLHA